MNLFVTILAIFVVKGYSFRIKYNRFRINLEKVELLYYDKNVVDCSLKVFKYNRTIFASNATVVIKQDISSESVVRVRTYEFLNNEYKPFAVNAQKTFCAFIEEEYSSIFYKDLNNENSHIFPKKCPTPVGKYTLVNYVPNSGNYPIELPFKKIMIESIVFFKKRTISHFKYYVFFDRDIVYREIYG